MRPRVNCHTLHTCELRDVHLQCCVFCISLCRCSHLRGNSILTRRLRKRQRLFGRAGVCSVSSNNSYTYCMRSHVYSHTLHTCELRDLSLQRCCRPSRRMHRFGISLCRCRRRRCHRRGNSIPTRRLRKRQRLCGRAGVYRRQKILHMLLYADTRIFSHPTHLSSARLCACSAVAESV